MIVFIRQPFIVQNYPIVAWDGIVPERSKQLHVRVDLDLLHDKGDGEKINALMKAVRDLMEDATFRDTGNKVRPSNLANMQTADGRNAVVPAESLPRGMLIGKEQEDGQRQQTKNVQQEEGGVVSGEPPGGLRIVRAEHGPAQDGVRDEGGETGGEEPGPW